MLDYLLFALACFGNAYLLMVFVNIVYSQAYHRGLLKIVRALMGLLIVGGPVAFAIFYRCAVVDCIERGPYNLESFALAFYLLIVLAMTAIVFPVVTIRRARRPSPSPVVSEVTITIDVAKELGQPPYGDGKHRSLAKLPLNDIFRVDITTLTLALPNLPASWDGLTLLQISDLHFYRTPAIEFYECIVRRCLAEGASRFAADYRRHYRRRRVDRLDRTGARAPD